MLSHCYPVEVEVSCANKNNAAGGKREERETEGGRERDRGHMMRFSGVKVCHPPVGRRISGRDREKVARQHRTNSATEEPVIYTSSAMSADCSYINTGE